MEWCNAGSWLFIFMVSCSSVNQAYGAGTYVLTNGPASGCKSLDQTACQQVADDDNEQFEVKSVTTSPPGCSAGK